MHNNIIKFFGRIGKGKTLRSKRIEAEGCYCKIQLDDIIFTSHLGTVFRDGREYCYCGLTFLTRSNLTGISGRVKERLRKA